MTVSARADANFTVQVALEPDDYFEARGRMVRALRANVLVNDDGTVRLLAIRFVALGGDFGGHDEEVPEAVRRCVHRAVQKVANSLHDRLYRHFQSQVIEDRMASDMKHHLWTSHGVLWDTMADKNFAELWATHQGVGPHVGVAE